MGNSPDVDTWLSVRLNDKASPVVTDVEWHGSYIYEYVLYAVADGFSAYVIIFLAHL